MRSSEQRSARAIVLLGTQRFDSTVGAEVRELNIDGPIALVSCGWLERESDDEALRAHLGKETVNLKLYERAEQVFASDRELAAAHREKQQILRYKQDFYRVRLAHELEANHVIRQRRAPDRVHREEDAASIASIRALDEYHLAQCAKIDREFVTRMRLEKRESVARHRIELAEIMRRCTALAITGGHVASMINRLRLFGISELIDDHAVFAWSGGAMALTDRIVLFHDSPPEGAGASELLDYGLGLVPNVVVLPQPETRLRLDDPERVGVLARRFSPAHCLAFPAGSHVRWSPGRLEQPVGVIRLMENGQSAPFMETYA